MKRAPAAQKTVAGRCYCCKGWTATGRLAAEDVGASGGGGETVVCCAGCAGPHPAHRRARGTRTWQL